jgi:hypothetical protein
VFDSQTFNINRLFIKSGLYYFYYIIFIFILLIGLLGRSKSEQYFGFLDIFSYINFILGYIPLVFSDATYQIVLIVYVLYNTVINLFYRLINKLTSNTLSSVEGTVSSLPTKLQNKPQHKQLIVNFNNLFNTAPQSIPFFSKTLSKLHTSLTLVSSNMLNSESSNKHFFLNNLNMLTLQIKKPKYFVSNTLCSSESLYTNSQTLNNFKVINSQIHLNDIYKFNRLSKSPIFFNFNIENNLNIAKQSRWFTKNSLLSESIIPNSFLITQAKKLIGLGFLDKDFTDKTL